MRDPSGEGQRRQRELERRVATLEQLVDDRTRQLEQALVDLRDLTDRSHLDPLTGLTTRSGLRAVLADLAARDVPCAVVAIDVDRFGRINESLGHDAGDLLLSEMAARLNAAARPRDTIARWGGDEFVVVMPGVREVSAALAAAEQLRRAVCRPWRNADDPVVPSVSIGVAVPGREGTDPDRLLRAADSALDRAKGLGKNRVEVFGEELRHDARRRFETEGLLHAALERGWFELHFQPVHPNSADHPLAAEALLRLRHPDGRLLAPGEFLDVAEETGLARPIGDWVLREAATAAAGWTHSGEPFMVAVNVSASQLDDAFPGRVLDSMNEVGLDPASLVVELTEHTLLEAGDDQVKVLVDLRESGVRIALDDFGTAYSSLSHLRRFPVDVVKIDRSFVAGICRSDQDNAIVRAVVDLSRTFHFRVIAEGVETTEQLDQQRRLGCHGAQGFLIGRPKPAVAFGELLSTRPLLEVLSRRSA